MTWEDGIRAAVRDRVHGHTAARRAALLRKQGIPGDRDVATALQVLRGGALSRLNDAKAQRSVLQHVTALERLWRRHASPLRPPARATRPAHRPAHPDGLLPACAVIMQRAGARPADVAAVLVGEVEQLPDAARAALLHTWQLDGTGSLDHPATVRRVADLLRKRRQPARRK